MTQPVIICRHCGNTMSAEETPPLGSMPLEQVVQEDDWIRLYQYTQAMAGAEFPHSLLVAARPGIFK